ncbi:MAG: OsmC family protein [Candidatus Kapaibacteriota bacterium]
MSLLEVIGDSIAYHIRSHLFFDKRPWKMGNFAPLSTKMNNLMVSISLVYEGELRCKAVHDPSGNMLITDAPIDNKGKGASFSPTDLLATSLGACMLTIMGIAAEARKLDISGTKVQVHKHMINEPVRRIGKLDVTIILPHYEYSESELKALHLAAQNCPVMMSIHPDTEVNFTLSKAELS